LHFFLKLSEENHISLMSKNVLERYGHYHLKLFYFQNVLEGTIRKLTGSNTCLKKCPLCFGIWWYITVTNQQKF